MIIWCLSNCNASEKRIVISSLPCLQDKYNRSAGKLRIFFIGVVVNMLLNTLSIRLYCAKLMLDSFQVYLYFSIVELATTPSLSVSDCLE